MNRAADANTERARGRGPSPAKTAKTRRTIVDAALETFLERGYSETRMVDVAGRAGVAKGTIYLYFADKEALFEGVVREVIVGPLEDIGAHEPAPGESTRMFVIRAVGPLMRDMERSRRAAVIRLVLAEGGRFPAVAAMYRRLVLEPIIDIVRTVAQRAIAHGEMSSDALLRFPMLLFAPGLVSMVWNGLYGAEEPIEAGAVFEAYVGLIFGPPHDDPGARGAP